jgi:hypothetical protein
MIHKAVYFSDIYFATPQEFAIARDFIDQWQYDRSENDWDLGELGDVFVQDTYVFFRLEGRNGYEGKNYCMIDPNFMGESDEEPNLLEYGTMGEILHEIKKLVGEDGVKLLAPIDLERALGATKNALKVVRDFIDGTRIHEQFKFTGNNGASLSKAEMLIYIDSQLNY